MTTTPTLTHLALHVGDIAAAVGFYQEVCGLNIVRDYNHTGAAADRTVWLAEPGREKTFIFVLFGGATARERPVGDASHLGFAMASREAVDTVAATGRARGCLHWEPVQHPFPAGYLCALADPDGNLVEFSYGQPLGPGAPED